MNLESVVKKTENEMRKILAKYGYRGAQIMHYGAISIDPKNLVIKICVNSDTERNGINTNGRLMGELRSALANSGYPADAVYSASIGADSQQQVDRNSNGNWYNEWK